MPVEASTSRRVISPWMRIVYIKHAPKTIPQKPVGLKEPDLNQSCNILRKSPNPNEAARR
jgi:hypothetical protein